MTDIIILGIHGRMGQVLCELIVERNDCQVVGGVDLVQHANSAVPVAKSLEELGITADVVIDFSNPEATKKALQWCVDTKTACVICTTGLDAEAQALLAEATKVIPVFKSANMSLGINLLVELAQKAVLTLGDGYDIEIVEKHHHNKLDAPSGTALLLADEINEAASGKYEYVYDRHAVREKRSQNEIGIHAVRGGSIVGEHEILFCGPDEVISLSHSAGSRRVFANGAVNAAVYLKRKGGAGLYSMKQLVQEIV